jgi:hypothetical protein
VHVDEQTAIEHVVDRLKLTYPDVSSETIETVVHQNHARFDGRRVRDYVPLFVERDAKRELSLLSGLAAV